MMIVRLAQASLRAEQVHRLGPVFNGTIDAIE
jgi:hypothetical protein